MSDSKNPLVTTIARMLAPLLMLALMLALPLMLTALLVPGKALAEHCAGAIYVDELEPNQPEIWSLDETRALSWLLASTCGLLTYEVELSRNGGPFEVIGTTDPLLFDGRFEFPWLVTGSVDDELQFRVHRVIPDRTTPPALTATITIGNVIANGSHSWSTLKAGFQPRR